MCVCVCVFGCLGVCLFEWVGCWLNGGEKVDVCIRGWIPYPSPSEPGLGQTLKIIIGLGHISAIRH